MADDKPEGSLPFQMPTFPGDFDFTKFFSEMKMPAIPDMEEVLNAHKRNLEALADANRVALEGAQAVARRQMEITQSTIAGLTATMREISVSDTPATRVAKQTDLLKQA